MNVMTPDDRCFPAAHFDFAAFAVAFSVIVADYDKSSLVRSNLWRRLLTAMLKNNNIISRISYIMFCCPLGYFAVGPLFCCSAGRYSSSA